MAYDTLKQRIDGETTGTESSSYRQILRSSSIIGGASVINIAVGLFRVKVAAVLLGPAGVGLLGLMQNFISILTVIFSLGLANAGIRHIAQAFSSGNSNELAAAKRALLYGTAAMAAMAFAIVWTFGDMLADHVFGNALPSAYMFWLGIGISISIAVGSLNALLNGARRIGDLARVSVISSLVSTSIAMPALVILREKGIILLVLSTPVATLFLSGLYASRVSWPAARKPSFSATRKHWQLMAKLGLAFTLSGLAVTGGEFIIRISVREEFGTEAVGHFQAAWTISVTYLSFVLAAMGSDYYPRLTGVISDFRVVNRMINEQAEAALLLAGPVLLGVMGAAPWVINLLYSERFHNAVPVLQWQILGDLLKVSSYPLGYLLLALGRSRLFVLTDLTGTAVLIVVAVLGLPLWGIQAAGIAFTCAFAIYLPLILVIAAKMTGFRPSRAVVYIFGTCCFLLLLVFAASRVTPIIGLVAGGVCSAYIMARAFRQFRSALPRPINLN